MWVKICFGPGLNQWRIEYEILMLTITSWRSMHVCVPQLKQCANACLCQSCKWSLRVEKRWGIWNRRYSQPHSKRSMALFNLDVKYGGVGRRKASCFAAWRCAECCRHFASSLCSPHMFPALVCLYNWLKAPKPSRSRINETDGIEVLRQLSMLYELLTYVVLKMDTRSFSY
jgi:hypothetical protein